MGTLIRCTMDMSVSGSTSTWWLWSTSDGRSDASTNGRTDASTNGRADGRTNGRRTDDAHWRNATKPWDGHGTTRHASPPDATTWLLSR